MSDPRTATDNGVPRCGPLVHRGGRYLRLDTLTATRCLNCGKDIDDLHLPGVLLT